MDNEYTLKDLDSGTFLLKTKTEKGGRLEYMIDTSKVPHMYLVDKHKGNKSENTTMLSLSIVFEGGHKLFLDESKNSKGLVLDVYEKILELKANKKGA